MSFSSLLEQFVLNLPITELLDSTLFISIYDFVKFDIQKCIKIAKKVYEDLQNGESDQEFEDESDEEFEDIKIDTDLWSISKKIAELDDFEFWNRLIYSNVYVDAYHVKIFKIITGLFFTFEYTVLHAVKSNKTEKTFNFGMHDDRYKKLQRNIYNFMKKSGNRFTQPKFIKQQNKKILNHLNLVDLQFLFKLKNKIENGLIKINPFKIGSVWTARGFRFDEFSRLIIIFD